MKSFRCYILEKLKIKHDSDIEWNPEIFNYRLMKKLLSYTRNIKDNTALCNKFDEMFKKHSTLKSSCINYIDINSDCPEMLDETTAEIVGYFKDFKENEFDKYIE